MQGEQSTITERDLFMYVVLALVYLWRQNLFKFLMS
jgi:hypothetical protein